MIRLHKFLTTFRRKAESGSSELPVTLVILPFAIFLIFALIDVTFYMQTRANLQATLRDATRAVALYGGNSKASPINPLGKDVSTVFSEALYTPATGCKKSFCGKDVPAPKITCTPSLATSVGQTVTCTLRYQYRPVANDSFFGFSTWTSEPFTLTETSISETRF
jgi:Flp pilus assembly protein TadG